MTLAFSGHIDLFEHDKKQIQQLLQEKLLYLKQHKNLTKVVAGVAEGADQLAIEVCKELSIKIQFFNEAVIKKETESESEYYARQCEFMVANCQQFMVVWDGVFTQKKGGTSWLVQLLIDSKKKRVIHHLITPRQSNPFVISSLNAKGFQPFENNFVAKLPWLPKLQWASFVVGGKDNNKNSSREKADRISSILGLWQSFIIPSLFAVITVFLGIWGYHKNFPNDSLNNFFRAVNFITLNDLLFENENLFLQIARFTGMLTPISAISFGLYAATAYLRRTQKLKNWTKKPDQFVVILGNTIEANDLALDLAKRDFKVLQILGNQEKETLVTVQSNLLHKNYTKEIDDSFFEKIILNASLVYLMDEDKVNLKYALQLESYVKSKTSNILKKLYVHIVASNKAQLLNNISTELKEKLILLNIKHNTVRRLLNYYPVDLVNKESNTISIHIITFNELAKVLCKHLLSQVHIEADKKVELHIYDENPKVAENEFYKTFNSLKKKDIKENIESYIWNNWQISFYEYQQNTTINQPFLENILENQTNQKTTSVYFCAEDSLTSVSNLALYLPKINQLQKETLQKIQFFCYYNTTDKAQEIKAERYLNKIASNILVTCFGNLLEECSYQAINEDVLDDLAISISNWYDQKHNISNTPSWGLSSYTDKESNRQAADHIWLKWRWILRNTKNNNGSVQELIHQFEQLEDDKLEALSEIEHRRWCANLVLSGYEVLPKAYKDDWTKNKTQYKSQFFHRDLISFEELTTEDKAKDADQIKGIPTFILNTYQ